MIRPTDQDDVAAVIETYADMVRRICCLHLLNRTDVEDVFQEVFLQYFLHRDSMADEPHRKAWLCRVTFNRCKDFNRKIRRRREIGLDQMEIPCETKEESEVMSRVLSLPPREKTVVYLHYCEGMTIPEIAGLMHKNVNSVYSWLHRAKKTLKRQLEADAMEEGEVKTQC